MTNQTTQNDENNRGKNEKEALLNALRPIWQGCQFWNRTFKEELSKVDVAEIRQLIEDENGVQVEGQQREQVPGSS